MNTQEKAWPHGFKQMTPENWLVPDMPSFFPLLPPQDWIKLTLEPKLHVGVPNEISGIYEVARGAIIQGWFFYPLLTLGHEQLNRVQETAARTRCEQLKITPANVIKSGKRKGQTREPNFSELIAVLAGHGRISKKDVSRWEATRRLRNSASHPKRQSIYTPVMAVNGLRVTAELIDKLFDVAVNPPPTSKSINSCMNSTNSRPKKSPSSKARRKVGKARCAVPVAERSVRRRNTNARRPASLRQQFREWRVSLPTALERDTLLMPDVIAESVVQEAAEFLGEEFPARHAVWLAAKAELCYSPHRQFYRRLRSKGDDAREWLRAYMRHWLASLLGLERPDLHHCLPVEFGNGRRLPPGRHPRINRRGFIPDLLPNPRTWNAARVTRNSRWAWLASLDNGKSRAAKRRHRHRPANRLTPV